MYHPHLHPVDPGNTAIPACYDNLQAWADRLPGWFSDPAIPKPKASLLCGLPGVGKGTAVKVIARLMNRPLFRLDPACDASALSSIIPLLQSEENPSVLWIDQPGESHTGILRWLLDQHPVLPFVLFTTTTPHKLPQVFLRADVLESVWHLDLPDARQRCALWHEVIAAACREYHAQDTVKLSQLSIRFTAGEIRAAFDRAVRQAGKVPDEGELIDAVLALHPIAHAMEENLACVRAWARLHASEAAAVTVGAEL